ncbi:VWA domain-containing protein [Mycobacterium sp. M1]|uniref:VWA domain-containing protein n=1 Tax=Mycolicibacter acidiphilus TaxID=2835306 RepID=A0ABS5RHE2_9MYCO|nr:vWA domain-containing protein [Mycolicibacter acidiphilus]MBS9533710.1 VWA domain-containing protein [Mycolicibacter acidiphilus]
MVIASRIRWTWRGPALLLRLLAAAALIAMIGAVGMMPSAAADSQGTSRFGACLAAQKAGDLLLLFDESRSLQATDPGAARVRAARNLLETLSKYADRIDAKLDVAVAGFADTYTRERDWTPLTGASVGGVSDSLAAIASKNNGIDTDYWLALDGARQELTKGATGSQGTRCQAVAWFSDGTIDYTARPVTKPYADGIKLDAPNGITETGQKAVQSICRPGGLADQLRSSGIIMLGIGLGANQTPGDFDVMSAISTGKGLGGKTCGDIVNPVPGDFIPVSNVDDMLFAFDALNPEPGVSETGGVCQKEVCPEARHNFVLDGSIVEVNILGSGGVPGVEPYLISPSGQTVQLPQKDGKTDVDVDGTQVSYEWKSDSAQTISMKNTNSPHWVGQWAIVYVDTTGQHPDAASRVNIHITTDIFPTLVGADKVAWHSGQVVNDLTFGMVDGQGRAVQPGNLAGTAVLSASLVPAGGAPIPLLTSVGKDDIGRPVSADLTNIGPGDGVLKMSLVITTAATADPEGAPIPGTQLSPQEVAKPIQILPKLGLPTLGNSIDFGTVEAAAGASATLSVAGPGCAWITDIGALTIAAGPEGIGTPRISSPANSAQNCLQVPAGETAELTVALHTDSNGHGSLNGTVPVRVSALDHPDDAQTVPVSFTASLVKPLNTTNFVLVLIAALLLGPGIPLALLYLSKWLTAKIPDNPLLAERIGVDVSHDVVQRNGKPFAMAETDLVNPVTGLPAGGARRLSVLGVNLAVVMGRSPFGAGHVVVDAGGMVSVGSQLPGSDKSGLHAVLPLAVHNSWVLLHDPRGPEDCAEVLLLVSGTTGATAREQIYDDIAQRLPDLLKGLRLRATEAGMVSAFSATGPGASPFGETSAAGLPPGQDPFGAGAPQPPAAPMSFGAPPPPGGGFPSGGDAFGGGADPFAVPATPAAAPPPPPPPPAVLPPPPSYGAAPTPAVDNAIQPPDYQQPPRDELGYGQPPPPTPIQQPDTGAPRPPEPPPPWLSGHDSDPFDPFGEGN